MTTFPASGGVEGQTYMQGGPMLYRVVLAFAILASATTLRAPAETLEERIGASIAPAKPKK